MINLDPNSHALADIGLHEGLDCDRWVFHYTNFETATTHILPERKLRFGLLQNTNDPLENRLNFGAVGCAWKTKPSYDPVLFDSTNIIDVFRSHLANRVTVLCTARDTHTFQSKYPWLSRGFMRPRMWAQYGESSQGVCLALNRERLSDSLRRITGKGAMRFAGEMLYSPELHKLAKGGIRGEESANHFFVDEFESDPIGVIEAKISRFATWYLFCKAPDWAAEAEYRWAVYRRSEGPIFVDIEDSLEAIVLGPRASSERAAALTEITRTIGLRAVQLEWSFDGCSMAPLHLPS